MVPSLLPGSVRGIGSWIWQTIITFFFLGGVADYYYFFFSGVGGGLMIIIIIIPFLAFSCIEPSGNLT